MNLKTKMHLEWEIVKLEDQKEELKEKLNRNSRIASRGQFLMLASIAAHLFFGKNNYTLTFALICFISGLIMWGSSKNTRAKLDYKNTKEALVARKIELIKLEYGEE